MKLFLIIASSNKKQRFFFVSAKVMKKSVQLLNVKRKSCLKLGASFKHSRAFLYTERKIYRIRVCGEKYDLFL